KAYCVRARCYRRNHPPDGAPCGCVGSRRWEQDPFHRRDRGSAQPTCPPWALQRPSQARFHSTGSGSEGGVMALDLVTAAIMEMLKNSLRAQPAVPEDAFSVVLASPDEGAGEADLSLFLYLVTPAPELRNAERIRPWPTSADAPRLLEPAVPI